MVEISVPERLLHSKVEASHLLCISVRKLEQLILSKQIRTVRVGKRRLIPRRELERLARQAG